MPIDRPKATDIDSVFVAGRACNSSVVESLRAKRQAKGISVSANEKAMSRRARLQEWRQAEYPDFDPWHFNTTVDSEVTEDSCVLEIGAGSGVGLQTQMPLKSRVKLYAGVDIDPRVLENPMLHEAHVADAVSLPYDDNTFDLVFHTMVAEHLDDPEASVRESLRVLKPGGLLMFHTVSYWYYASLVAAATPHWFHTLFVKHLGMGRIEEDVFPTVYRINTRRAINRIARNCGADMEIENIGVPTGLSRIQSSDVAIGGVVFPDIREMVSVAAGPGRVPHVQA